MKSKILVFFTLIGLFFLPLPINSAEYQYDLGINSQDIFFSKDVFIAGETVRVYAVAHNYGDEDISGYISFYQGDQLIGDSQIVSVRAGGLSDEVFVDWIVPDAPTNIRAQIKGQSPQDKNLLNDEALSGMIIPEKDTDQDGTPDGADTDDDNDGLSDEQEIQGGTSSTNSDTDGDGVSDSQDAYPLDAKKSTLPAPKPEPPKTKSPQPANPTPAPQKESPGIFLTGIKTESPVVAEVKPEDKILLKVSISYSKKDWNTFIFKAEANSLVGKIKKYQWDFGDGLKSAQKEIEHSFRKSGSYYVILEVIDDAGNAASDQIRIDISFFNFGNWQLWAIISLLIFLIILIYLLSKYGLRDNRESQNNQ